MTEPGGWTPDEDTVERANLTRFMAWLAETGRGEFADYHQLWSKSVDDIAWFWDAVWHFFDIRATTPPDTVLASREMPGAQWFPGATLNYADRSVPARERQAPGAGCGRRGWFDGMVLGSGCGPKPRRSRTTCAGSASSRATASSDTCPTSVRRSRRSWARLVSARRGRCAIRISRSTGWSRGSGSSNRACWWPATVRCTAGSAMTAAGNSPRFARSCRRSRRRYWCPGWVTRPVKTSRRGRSARTRRTAGDHAGAVRPSAVGVVLVGHHRHAQGHRARSRRCGARTPQVPEPAPGSAVPATDSCGIRPPAG